MACKVPTLLKGMISARFAFLFQEGAAAEMQDPSAGGSKPKVKVKSIDLPIVANNIRQLDSDVLINFAEYEVRAAAAL